MATDLTGSLIQALMGQASPQNNTTQALGNLSSLLGGISSGAANQSANQGKLIQGYDQNMIAAQNSANSTRDNALKNLAQSSYLLGGGNQAQAPTSLQLGNNTYAIPSGLGFTPPPISDAQKQGAQNLQNTANSILAPGGTYTPQPPTYAQPSTLQNIGNYGSLIAGGGAFLNSLLNPSSSGGSSSLLSKALGGGGTGAAGGGASSLFNADGSPVNYSPLQSTGSGVPLSLSDNPGITSLMSAGGVGATDAALGGLNADGTLAATMGAPAGLSVGDATSGASDALSGGASGAGSVMSSLLGTYLPIAGTALGAYQMLQNKGTGSDILGGAETGAGIGTLVMPGIGTAIGAGIGALGGGIESLFPHVTANETAARNTGGTLISQLTQGATPAEQQEAQASGMTGNNMQDALAQIRVRDALMSNGMSADQAGSQASSLMQQLMNSVSKTKTPQSVQQAGNAILQALQGQA